MNNQIFLLGYLEGGWVWVWLVIKCDHGEGKIVGQLIILDYSYFYEAALRD